MAVAEPLAAGLSISDAARATGVSGHTLLTRLRSTGMPIRRMRRYADLVRAGDGNEAERLALLEAHRIAVRTQLEAMERNLAVIDHKIEIYRRRSAT